MRKSATKIKRPPAVAVQRRVSRHREYQALEALVALALRNTYEPVTAAEIERYTRRPVRLTRADQAALNRARPKLLAALKRELRPDAKRLESGWGKPANDKIQQ
jgi:hypothetical protein